MAKSSSKKKSSGEENVSKQDTFMWSDDEVEITKSNQRVYSIKSMNGKCRLVVLSK